MLDRLTFRPRHRIRRQRDFERIFRRRCSVGSASLVLYVDHAGLDHPRLGLRVGKRIGPAVVRNREKRLLREAFRQAQHSLPALDMVIVLRRAGGTLAEYAEAMTALAAAAGRKLNRLTERTQEGSR